MVCNASLNRQCSGTRARRGRGNGGDSQRTDERTDGPRHGHVRRQAVQGCQDEGHAERSCKWESLPVQEPGP